MNWLKILSVPLALTVILELAAALYAGKRGRALWYVVLVNVLTNPLVVASITQWELLYLPCVDVWILFAEAAAVVTEALIYRRHRQLFAHPWLFSLLLNGFSYGTGVFLEPFLLGI